MMPIANALLFSLAISAQATSSQDTSAAALSPPGAVDDDTAPAPAAEPVPAPAPVEVDAPKAASLEDAIFALTADAEEINRVAIAPVRDDDKVRGRQMESALARAVLDADYEVLTADHTGRLLPDSDGDGELNQTFDGVQHAADHVLVSERVEVGGRAQMVLKLINTERGAVVSTRAVDIGEGKASTVDVRTVRGAIGTLADQVFTAMQEVPGDLRYQRLAVLDFTAEDADAKNSSIGGYVQTQLSQALAERGFLVVARKDLAPVLDEIGIATMSESGDAPAAGKALDAQAIVVGSIATAGDRFLLTARVINTTDGEVIGTGKATLARENAVLLSNAAIETKSALGAMFRSGVAPGWGQYYNDEPIKAAALGGLTYALAAVTVTATAAAAIAFFAFYSPYEPAPGISAEQQKSEVVLLRNITNALLWTAMASGGVTALAWGFNVTDALLTGINSYE